MSRPTSRGRLVGALVVAVALLVGSVAWVVAANGFPGAHPAERGPWSQTRVEGTDVPNLPGTVVHATLTDMGGSMMGGRRGAATGVMWLRIDRSTVPAGTVSFVATNRGTVDHELVVLPLAPGQQVGTRPVGADGTVDETGSLGEASESDAAGTGDGIEPGASGWVTLTLQPGRYELVCNIAGHYAAGMSTELTVV